MFLCLLCAIPGALCKASRRRVRNTMLVDLIIVRVVIEVSIRSKMVVFDS